ncbi:hypothetical protein CABS02_10548 [Colletotrichum abscissum]|uniref:tyrosinase n=1 Tax=Colletotrichum abscissum TaxID=1671311 RepID=A0A9Q0B0U4_9PEZI|nr:hypothetical protein CABS02_10548 [Colletotrichum abscissum]
MSAPFQSYAITGIPTEGTGPPPSRREINAWATQNPIQLSLFIQALRIFQSMDFMDQLSYYRIAGIHGLPATSWDNDPIPIEVTKSYPGHYNNPHKGGSETPDFYCPHNSLIFPTWHRAYLLLFEQRLWEIMTKEIVPTAPSSAQQQWMTEANAWRLPYWDWANIPSVPDVASTQKITIQMPDGTSQEDWNPLYQFSTANMTQFKTTSMQPILADQTTFGQFAIFDEPPVIQTNQTYATSRWGLDNPITTQQISGIVNNQAVNTALQTPPWANVQHAKGLNGRLAEQVSRLFVPSNFNNFAEFATTAHGKQGPCGWLSLELLHNCIHDFTGGVGYTPDPPANGTKSQPPGPPPTDSKVRPVKYGYGHMADLGVAAFDPIFWLHHCNVDRQLAIFQSLNSVPWWSGQDVKNDPASNDPLYPFHTDANFGHWTSDALQYWTKLGYTYDDLTPSEESNAPTVTPEVLIGRLTAKYGILRNLLKENSHKNVAGLDNDFIINVLYNRYALGGRSYIIYFFLGSNNSNASGNPQDNLWSEDYIGSIHSFSRNWKKSGVACANCVKQESIQQLSKGQVPLTLQLLKRAIDEDRWNDIKHLGSDHVLDYVKKNLHWRVVALPGEVIQEEVMPDLEVTFLAGKGTHPEDPEKSSEFHDYNDEWKITKGSNGNCRWEQTRKDGKKL